MSHTPGTWVTRRDDSTNEQIFVALGDHKGRGRVIGMCEMWGTSAEDKANARLIAAAPETLAALRQLTEYLVAYEGSRFVTQLDAAEAAIAKATGEVTA